MEKNNRAHAKRFLILSGIILFCWNLVGAIASANFDPNFFWTKNEITSHELVEKIDTYSSMINWTTGKVRTEIALPIKFDNPNIGQLFSQYSQEIRELLRQNLIKALGYLRISAIFSLKDYYSQKNDIRFEIIDRVDSAFYYPPVQKKNQFHGIAELALYGKNGLATLFYRDIENMALPTNYPSSKMAEYYDSIIIDTLIFKEFNPSIEMRIYDQDGRLIYGPEIVEKKALTDKGICEFTTSLTYAFKSARSGTKILYIMPIEVKGKMGTDLVIHNEDAAKIMANPLTVKCLKQAQIIVVKPEN
ncbi:MAG: hypothetical protein A2Y33_14175 [Spirochaetes bacterium GWF1_51_8]|nr:MAG: hypothetical protein A2Y33_14175 [Spirochaetes bacterium GWF1_51_8]